MTKQVEEWRSYANDQEQRAKQLEEYAGVLQDQLTASNSAARGAAVRVASLLSSSAAHAYSTSPHRSNDVRIATRNAVTSARYTHTSAAPPSESLKNLTP